MWHTQVWDVCLCVCECVVYTSVGCVHVCVSVWYTQVWDVCLCVHVSECVVYTSVGCVLVCVCE